MMKIKVLIVDDSKFMREYLRGVIESTEDIEVVGEASNGIEALVKINELSPDVVTLDQVMPEMTGLECLREINKLSVKPAVVMVSGFVREYSDLTIHCLAAGASSVVLKPGDLMTGNSEELKNELISKIIEANKST